MNDTKEEKYIKQILDDDNTDEFIKIDKVMMFLRSLHNECIEQSGDKRKYIDDYKISVGLLCMRDGAVGCVEEKDGWYSYETYERNVVEFSGPFNIAGVIKAMAFALQLQVKMDFLKFSDDEF